MLDYRSRLFGYNLNYATKRVNKNKRLTIQLTKTPFTKYLEERMTKEPVVIKHVEDKNEVILTVTYFK